jgi:hypothetical protein
MSVQSERSVFPEWDPLAPGVVADQRRVRVGVVAVDCPA